MKNWKSVLGASLWVFLSFIAGIAGVVDVKGIYPDWVEHASQIFSRFVCGSLIFAWSIWILWLLLGRRRQLYSWFRVVVCLALFLSIVRVVFICSHCD
jgi:hypothetical protein